MLKARFKYSDLTTAQSLKIHLNGFFYKKLESYLSNPPQMYQVQDLFLKKYYL